MTDDLFSGTDQEDQKDYLSELVGEGKKFKDPQALARGKAESDAYIEQLKRENAEMRGELNTRLTLEELMTKINEKKDAPLSNSEPTSRSEQSANTKPTFTPEEIDKLLDQKLQQKEAAQTAKSNLNFVKQKLSQHYGQDFPEKLKNKLAEIGIGQDFANDVAAKNPQAFLHMLGLAGAGNQGPNPTPPRGTVNTASFQPANTSAKKYADFQKMRRDDPKTYWLPATQNEMFRLAKEQGDAFYS